MKKKFTVTYYFRNHPEIPENSASFYNEDIARRAYDDIKHLANDGAVISTIGFEPEEER